MLPGQLNLCWWMGKQDLPELKATHYTTARLYGPDSAWATPPHPSTDSLVRGFILSQTTNRLYNKQVILLLVFHWETEHIPDSALPNRILVREPKNHSRIPQRCLRNPKGFDAIHQGMIRKLKGDRVMIVGPTSQASGKLRLLGSFQKSAPLSVQIFLQRQVSELCCYTGQLCGELLRIFVAFFFF